MKRLIISLILLIFFMGGKDVFAQATVEGKLILPEPAPGRQYWVIVDQDYDGGNGYVRYCLGICGSDTEISYGISDVPAGTYYIYGCVRIVSSHANPPEVGDYMGAYDGTFGESPNEPNAVVPAFGTVTFDIILSKWTGDVDVTPPATPTNFTATAGDSKVTLSWNANIEPDLALYNLFRGTELNGWVDYLYTASNTTTSYIDNNVVNGTTYYYRIYAKDLSNNNSDLSPYVSATPTAPADVTPPATPTNFTATAGDSKVTLSWNANIEPDLALYNLFRGTELNGWVDYLYTASNTTTSYIDNNVVNGTTYYYRIYAKDLSNNNSDLSPYVSATPTAPADVTPPATPTITSTSVFQGGVKLEWTQNTEPDLANYYIYRSKTSGFTPSLSKPIVTSNKIATVDKSLTQYNDITNVESNTVYYYKMSAVDNSGNESGYSNQATVTTLGILNDNRLTKFALYQNVPNPFNPITVIEFSIPNDTDVNIIIYDLMGNEVKTLINELKPVGQYQVNWDGNDNSGQSVSGGIYFYQIQAGDYNQTKKMVLLK